MYIIDNYKLSKKIYVKTHTIRYGSEVIEKYNKEIFKSKEEAIKFILKQTIEFEKSLLRRYRPPNSYLLRFIEEEYALYQVKLHSESTRWAQYTITDIEPIETFKKILMIL